MISVKALRKKELKNDFRAFVSGNQQDTLLSTKIVKVDLEDGQIQRRKLVWLS